MWVKYQYVSTDTNRRYVVKIRSKRCTAEETKNLITVSSELPVTGHDAVSCDMHYKGAHYYISVTQTKYEHVCRNPQCRIHEDNKP